MSRPGFKAAAVWWVHNLVAHPLIILVPPLGLWLHAFTLERLRLLDPDHHYSELAGDREEVDDG